MFELPLRILGKTCPFHLAIPNNWVLQVQRQLQETQEDKLGLILELEYISQGECFFTLPMQLVFLSPCPSPHHLGPLPITSGLIYTPGLQFPQSQPLSPPRL